MNIDGIIGKLMGDSSSLEEKDLLKEWREEAEDNLQAINDIKKIAALSNEMKSYEDFDADSAWEGFESKMDETTEPSTNTKTFSIYKWSAVAAALIVVFAAVYLMLPSKPIVNENLYIADASIENINFTDGTTIDLDVNGQLEKLNTRSVILNGRAYFDVAKNKNNPFTIAIPQGGVTVLGTAFSLQADSLFTELIVEEGSVRLDIGDRKVVVDAGKIAYVKNKDIIVSPMKSNMVSWKNKRLVFKDMMLVDVVEALSRHFRKRIILEDAQKFQNCSLTTIFKDETLDQVLNELTTTLGLRYEIRDNVIYVVSSNC